ncbi:hypothetical protein [uncultured Kriegella sp.]|uniref:hypothetical protein n=1 Tax=uncultured Kriegella sp. TaxID=1798910 RepID=UPI0030DB8E42|tara:strand:+ start:332527 stop:332688 length:162 start_codon:yes stop_codon:yes gene_type:complete
MKKVVSIFAVLVMSFGLFSCEEDSNAEDTQALYETLDVKAGGDEEHTPIDGRD